jgi:hypothetical protein
MRYAARAALVGEAEAKAELQRLLALTIARKRVMDRPLLPVRGST